MVWNDMAGGIQFTVGDTQMRRRVWAQRRRPDALMRSRIGRGGGFPRGRKCSRTNAPAWALRSGPAPILGMKPIDAGPDAVGAAPQRLSGEPDDPYPPRTREAVIHYAIGCRC